MVPGFFIIINLCEKIVNRVNVGDGNQLFSEVNLLDDIRHT